MEIKKNTIYENRTYKYLYPTLKCYGEDLVEHLKRFFKLGVGIGDDILNESTINNIFILFDIEPPLGSNIDYKTYRDNFNTFLNWIRYQKYYVKDYIYKDQNLGEKQMLVLKLPLTIYQFSNFIYGHYSEIFSYEEMNNYFKPVQIPNKKVESIVNNRLKNTVDILTKNPEYIQTFVNIVNKDFGTNLIKEDYIDRELDYPIRHQDEIFNYKTNDI